MTQFSIELDGDGLEEIDEAETKAKGNSYVVGAEMVRIVVDLGF